MPKKFTDAQLDELLAKGYLIVPDYYSGEQHLPDFSNGGQYA